MPLSLRDYQIECIKALHTRWDAGDRRVPVVLPTGAGKTVVFTHLADGYLTKNPGKRVLVLAHTDELVNQAAAKMRQTAGHRTVGIIKAAQNEVSAEVVVASVQSLRSAKRRAQLRNVGLIIVDECHHATAATYRTILDYFGAFGDPSCKRGFSGCDCAVDRDHGCNKTDGKDPVLVAGFTATLARGDRQKLSDVWQDVAFTRDIAFMIRRGYLLDVKGRRIEVPELDLDHVKKSGGDYAEGALAQELVDSFAPEIVAKAYVEHASDRQGLVFTPTVASAYAFAEAFEEEGIKTEVVHGALARDERRAILGRLVDGVTQVVVNCMVLTEGFDAPCVSCVVVARPTRSAPLYQQMVGRALRPDLSLLPADRGHALVLDVVGASRQHDLRTLVDLSTKEPDHDREDLDNLSLLELEDYLDEEEATEAGTPLPEEFFSGPVAVVEFDPLGRDSDRAWDRTAAGTYYLSTGSGYVFLADSVSGDPGTWDVVYAAAHWGNLEAAHLTEHRGLSFEMAIGFGSEVAMDAGSKALTGKRSAWRKKGASEAQLKVAARQGIEVPEGITSGELSALIDTVFASRAIDPLVAKVQRKRG